MNNKILILSGAGLSAESGLKTFRDNNGLWENYDVTEVCSVQGFRKDRNKVLDFYDLRRADLQDKIPNKAHEMISRISQKHPDLITVMTQNVDDLLEKAGCTYVIHLHGKLNEIVCEKCGICLDIGYGSIKNYSFCNNCKSKKMRHNVVMFGEPAPEYANLYKNLKSVGLLVEIGTSGEVLPVDQYARVVPYSILNNLEKSKSINSSCFDKTFYSKATDAASEIENLMEKFIVDGCL